MLEILKKRGYASFFCVVFSLDMGYDMGTLETRCHSILNADETRVDRLFFLSALYSQGESLSFFELDGGVEDVDGVYRHIKQHLCSFLDCFNGAVLGITGFSLFTLKDLLA